MLEHLVPAGVLAVVLMVWMGSQILLTRMGSKAAIDEGCADCRGCDEPEQGCELPPTAQ